MERRSVTSSTSDVSRPSMKILPDDGAINRLIIFMVVVLPQPDGPSSTHTAPAGTSMSTLSTAVTVPKVFVTRSSRIMWRRFRSHLTRRVGKALSPARERRRKACPPRLVVAGTARDSVAYLQVRSRRLCPPYGFRASGACSVPQSRRGERALQRKQREVGDDRQQAHGERAGEQLADIGLRDAARDEGA